MKKLVFCLLSLCLTSHSMGLDIIDALVKNGQIVGPDHPGYFNAVQLLRLEAGVYRPHCTGSLIAEDTVLTAAHCLTETPPTHLRFVNHDTDVETMQSALGILKPVISFVAHPDSREIPDYDIGFLKFSGGLPEGFGALPILMPEVELEAGLPITTVGFGEAAEAIEATSTWKRSATGKIGKVIANYWMQGIFSMLVEEPYRLVPGDSGGPTYIKYMGSWYILGVTYGDSSSNWPLPTWSGPRMIGAYAPSFHNWLETQADIELSGVGRDAVSWGKRPLADSQETIKELCLRRDLSRGGWVAIRELLNRRKTLNCSDLADLTEVRGINIYPDTPVPILRQFRNLKEINVIGYRSLDGVLNIENIENIEQANFVGGRPGLDNMGDFRNLRVLKVEAKRDDSRGYEIERISNWSRQLPNLYAVQLGGMPIFEIETLLQKKGLKVLICRRCELQFIGDLGSRTDLLRVDLSDNVLETVGGLASLRTRALRLNSNLITDLSPFASNQDIQLLEAIDNPLNETSCPLQKGQCKLGDQVAGLGF